MMENIKKKDMIIRKEEGKTILLLIYFHNEKSIGFVLFLISELQRGI